MGRLRLSRISLLALTIGASCRLIECLSNKLKREESYVTQAFAVLRNTAVAAVVLVLITLLITPRKQTTLAEIADIRGRLHIIEQSKSTMVGGSSKPERIPTNAEIEMKMCHAVTSQKVPDIVEI